MEDKLSTTEAAALVGCSRQNVLHSIKLGYLKAELQELHGGKRWLIRVADLMDWKRTSINLRHREVG